MTNKPRNRAVVFRLSQDEYRLLKDACERAGGRNLSDFTRSEVLQYLLADSFGRHVDSQFAVLEQRITLMQSQLNNLLRG